MRPSLKAVFFDAAGTLIHLPRPVGEHYRKIALRHGADLSADVLDQEFRRCWRSAPDRGESRTPQPDDDKGWWRALVRRVLDGILPASLQHKFPHEAYFEELYAHFARPGVWAAYPEVSTVLRSLSARGLKLAVISNFDRRLYDVLDHLQLTPFFTRIIISSEVGADKPDPVIFRKAMNALDVQPAEGVHVGDDPKRDGGATAVGLETFELDRPARDLTGLPTWLEARTTTQNELASRHVLS